MSTTVMTEATTTRGLPPPYTPPAHNFLDPNEDDEEENQPPATSFVINTPTTVHGSGNIIAVPPPDVPRLTAAVIATISQKMHLPRNFVVQINCGVNVIGDRNIVGSPAIRPLAATQQQQRATAQDTTTSSTSAGAGATSTPLSARSVAIPIHNVNVGKRKASEEPEDAPHTKKVVTNPGEILAGDDACLS